jgi:hypothetical protein
MSRSRWSKVGAQHLLACVFRPRDRRSLVGPTYSLLRQGAFHWLAGGLPGCLDPNLPKIFFKDFQTQKLFFRNFI